MRKTVKFCDDWYFHLGEIERKYPICKGPIYTQAKTEKMIWGAAAKGYNEKSDAYAAELSGREAVTDYWETVTLPHDYTIAQTPSKENNVTLGFFPLQNAWYRKHFTLGAEYSDKKVFLYFEAVATNATVYINGCIAGRNFGGAVPFRLDITDFIRFDEDNVVAVYVENSESEGWWYGGGGIYRPVWLIITEKVSIDLFGVYVHPEKKENDEWEIHTEITLRNDGLSPAEAQVENTVADADGTEICKKTDKIVLPPLSSKTLCGLEGVKSPRLWDTEDPYLYQLKTEVRIQGGLADTAETGFGFRTIRFDADRGFFLNGRQVKIKGVCCHQDYGLTGKAVPERVQRYRIRLLKEMGANGYRTAHYPHSEKTMEILDQAGFLVMDETRRFSTDKESVEALETLIRRDRNHPSVILWSVGNEEPITLTDNGRRITERLRETVKKLDKTRPVSSAVCDDPIHNRILNELDVIGVNYNIQQYDQLHAAYQNTPIIISECCATGTTRGWYLESNRKRGYINAFDHDTTNWFLGRERTWKYIAEREWIGGCYQWAGIEHRGEGGWWPRLCSAAGAVDLYLQKKDAFYQNLSHWTDKPMIHLLPHWNWKGFEGKEITVWAYTNCDEAELFLNGESLGVRSAERFGHMEWKVIYRPGRLEVKGYKGGEIAACDLKETTGEPYALKLRLEDGGVKPDDYAIITCLCVDSQGREVPDASPFIHFDTNELGAVEATGADNTDHTPPSCPDRKMWQGLCSVLVKTGDSSGVLKVYARSEGLLSAVLEIPLE